MPARQIRQNLLDFIRLAGADKRSARWGIWRVYNTLSSVSGVISQLPNKQDTWISSAGKVYNLIRELENNTGALFDNAEWYEVEAEAKGYSKHLLPVDFLQDCPGVTSTVSRPRGQQQAMVEFTVGPYVLYVPAYQKLSDIQTGIVQNTKNIVYAKSEADFEGFLDAVWDSFDNRVFVDRAMSYDRNWSRRLDYSKAPGTKDLLVGRKDLLDEIHQDYVSAKVDGEMVAWLLIGPPGTGKTTCVQHFAERIGCRYLHVSYNVLMSMKFDDIWLLKPDLLLLDDIDALSAETAKEAIDRLGTFKIPCFVTANDIEKFTDRVLRPGRIERIIEFHLPEPDERRAVFQHFLTQFKAPPLSTEEMGRLVELSEGFGHAHCRSIANRLSRKPFQRVVEEMETMRRLQTSKTKKTSEGKPAEPATPAPASE